ncbi:TPA: hypothetical protein ACPGNG_000951, partial [Haemophilus influenzae]
MKEKTKFSKNMLFLFLKIRFFLRAKSSRSMIIRRFIMSDVFHLNLTKAQLKGATLAIVPGDPAR